MQSAALLLHHLFLHHPSSQPVFLALLHFPCSPSLCFCVLTVVHLRVLITLHCTLRLDVPQSINMYTLNMLTLKEHKNTLYLSSATPKDTHRFKLSLFFAHSFSFPPLSPSPLLFQSA